MNKTWLLAIVLAASITPSFAQDKPSAVHLSQPQSQLLDAGQSGSAGAYASSSSSSSSSAGSAYNPYSASPHTTRDLLNSGSSGHGNSSAWASRKVLSGAAAGAGSGSKNGGSSNASNDGYFSPNGSLAAGSAFSSSQTNNSNNSSNNNKSHGSNNSSHSGGGSKSLSNSGAMSGGTATACPAATMQAFIDNFPEVRSAADSSFGGMMIHSSAGGGMPGKLQNPTSTFMKAPITWPNVVPGGPTQLPTTSVGASNNIPASIRMDGTGPVTATQMAAIASAAASFAATAPMMPDARLQSAKEELNATTQQQADNSGDMEKQQAGSAIDYVRTALNNFTVDADNQWNQLRNQLFLPIAILLLLPGAIATQVKATVAQGFPIFGEVSPVEGLYRSIVAIFLIPGTYLIVNYGIDLSNSMAYSIQQRYHEVFGTDMYRDAECAHIRAFGTRLPNENLGYIPNSVSQMAQNSATPRGKFEQGNVDVKLEDPCAGVYNVSPDKANEKVPYSVNAQRAAYNGAGAALAMTWNILCAFQMCYLYYLWFVGPIMAALWVYPVTQLRSAFPNWCEGVITLCFWSLFWNTVVLLMACFRGIDDTGTIIMEALNFLSTACVKYAFDFGSLVKAAGAEAGKMAEKAASSAKGGGGGSSGGGSGGGSGKASSPATAAMDNSKAGSVDPGAAKSESRMGSPLAGATAADRNMSVTRPAASDDGKKSLGAVRVSENVSAPVPGMSTNTSENLFKAGDVSLPPIGKGGLDSAINVPGMSPVSPVTNSFSNAAGAADQAASEDGKKQMQESELERLMQQKQQEQTTQEQNKMQAANLQASERAHAGAPAGANAGQPGQSAAAANGIAALSNDPLSGRSTLPGASMSFLPPSSLDQQILNKAFDGAAPKTDRDLLAGANYQAVLPGQGNANLTQPLFDLKPSTPDVSQAYSRASLDASQYGTMQSVSSSGSIQSADQIQLGKLYYDTGEYARQSIDSSNSAVLNSSLPVPDATAPADMNLYRTQQPTANLDNLVPGAQQNGTVIDVAGNTNTVVVDGGTATANQSMARSSMEAAAAVQSYAASTVAVNNYNELSEVNSTSNIADRAIVAVSPAAVTRLQRQDTNVEVRQASAPKAQTPPSHSLKPMPTKFIGKHERNATSHILMPGVPQHGKNVPPLQSGEHKQSETEQTAQLSLAEQIIYRNILHKQRTIDEASEEELALMSKLGTAQAAADIAASGSL